jgi:membrane associated rhomboid family serine protease
MMACWQVIMLINTIEQLLRRERALCSFFFKDSPALLPSEADTSFSGGALDSGKLHVFITASFCHASRSHFINNMIMLVVVAPQLEHQIGFVGILALYVISGAVGWMCTLYRLKTLCKEAWMWDTYKWQESLGASPSTYALAITAAYLLDPSHAVGPAVGVGVPIESADAMVSWFTTVLAVFLIPELCDGKIVFDPGQLLALLAMVMHTVFWAKTSIPTLTAINASAWLALYHFKTFSRTLYEHLKNGNTFQQADHTCHLGGSVVGLVAAMLAAGAEAPAAGHSPLVVGLSLLYLTVRVAFDI